MVKEILFLKTFPHRFPRMNVLKASRFVLGVAISLISRHFSLFRLFPWPPPPPHSPTGLVSFISHSHFFGRAIDRALPHIGAHHLRETPLGRISRTDIATALLQNRHRAAQISRHRPMNALTILPGLDGIRLPNGTRRPDLHHASKGGGHPYPKEMREQVIGIWQIAGGGDAGLAALKTPPIQALQAEGKFPHINTCKRWIVIFQDEDHFQ